MEMFEFECKGVRLVRAPILAAILLAAMSIETQAQSSDRSSSAANPYLPSADNLMRHVYALADDSMMGRAVHTEGYDMAARYVAEEFRRVGVGPRAGQGGSDLTHYFHTFEYEFPPESWYEGNVVSYNVIGVVPGNNPALASEQLVVSAHLDHVPQRGGQIFNGASDNASGVAVMLEVARLIARRPVGRTVVFAAFGAEEVGHVGSLMLVDSLVEHAVPVIANINIDDVGHLGRGPAGRPLMAALHEGRVCVDLFDMIRVHGDGAGVAITERYRDDVFTRSDHYSFYLADIPAIFFSSGGEHQWLHTPQDDADEMDWAQLQRLTSVVYQSVRSISEHIDMCGSQ
ncbi:MAG: M20/M25/M40 family metallo-hydrolase [Gemmatimonadota bacterium]|nr:MAG: M20/M25/M40 family metallo-hydrolase [Gemmatimonadota bacterium]